jgi:DUF1680 family protein
MKNFYLIGSILLTFIFNIQSQSLQFKYAEIPLGQITPTNWLKQQSDILKNGSTGHLDEFHKKIQVDNGWLGGKGDDWEETPYWLDGALPLAYITKDPVLIQKVNKYVQWTLNTQRPSGFFGPYSKYETETGKPVEIGSQGADWWPRMVMLKVLQQYYQATNDPKVIPFIQKYFAFQLKNLKENPLEKWTEWAKARGGDNLMIVYWLYNITKDPDLITLGDLIYNQSFQWTDMLGKRDWAIAAAYNQTGERWMERHAVNVGMGLKMPAIQYQIKNDPYFLNSLRTGFKDLMTLHGLPHGMFSGDEDIHGNDPVQGTELCATVEAMYSLEQIISISGETHYMDALERMTFNALPAQTTEDFYHRQYFGIANQVEVKKGIYNFSLPFSRKMNNVYGPFAGYTCCTANMHQGWPKYISHLWYATTDGGVAALVYGPNKLETKLPNGVELTIDEQTQYPFEDQIKFIVQPSKPSDFPIEFRIPIWCKEAIIHVNGKEIKREKGGQIVRIKRTWNKNDQVDLFFPNEITTKNWAKNSRSIEKGALIYALKIKEEVTKQIHPQEGEYLEIMPKSDWNFGLLKTTISNPIPNTSFHTVPFPKEFKWNSMSSPFEITTLGKKIPDWKTQDGVAHQPITTRTGVYEGSVNKESETIRLIPFGFTRLRVVAFPVVN